MEEEIFLSGYCRHIDGSRAVGVETDGQRVLSIGCGYESCPHREQCTVGKAIWDLINGAQK